jgi:hypothetical protein
MQQLVVITTDSNNINSYLKQGWRIAYPPISQHVASGSTYTVAEGRFLFVLEKPE